MKFEQLKANSVDEACRGDKIMALPATRHGPRQLMVVDCDDNTVYNSEFPTYPARSGPFGGNPAWQTTIQHILAQCQTNNRQLAAVYFSGPSIEYELIRYVLAKENAGQFKKRPIACYYVKPDLAEIEAEARISACANLIGMDNFAEQDTTSLLVLEASDDTANATTNTVADQKQHTTTIDAAMDNQTVPTTPLTTMPTDEEDPLDAIDNLDQTLRNLD